ncbi:molybdate ABC transporter substrate-binding protein [Sagittula sp. SSi028]|uniref:molybdate ABC transporter substrate-binding protein n=1 Tax=Sagittula sp. SSi028 TaxID=3400636 RepID=UPI003AF78D8F
MRRLALLFLAVFCAAPLRAAEVTVFAAASLRSALDDVAEAYQSTTEHRLSLSYAGSSALARQIQRGAPADIFLSANGDWMDVLQSDGLLQDGSRVDLLSNSLVLVSYQAGDAVEPAELPDILGEGRLAMALVDAVPAGIYGRQALTHLGIWPQIEPQVVQSDNVRAALALVALGAAPFGVVYSTDAMAEPRVHVRATFPDTSHDPIRYPAALTKDHDPAAMDFLQFLRSPEAAEIFTRHGFGVL